MTINRTIVIALILLFSVFNAFAQGREGNERARQKVKGTTIRMTPPDKFVQSEDFTGFMVFLLSFLKRWTLPVRFMPRTWMRHILNRKDWNFNAQK
jgi:hypothetical protein